MESRFLAAIDAAVQQALPAGWPRLPRQWLPARGSIQARHAFRFAAGGDGAQGANEANGAGRASEANRDHRAPYLALVVAPPRGPQDTAVERDLAALVEHVMTRGASVLLLYQHEDDPDGWVREHVDFPHPRFLCLGCAPSGRGEEYIAAPALNWRAPLSRAIRDFWSRELVYRGPMEGMQTVGLETMKDECWRCRAALDTVTGIVFPDRGVADWSLPDWTYYQQLLELARIPDSLIPALQAAIDLWRAGGDHRLTVLRWRFSKTVEYAYWAAECTACGAFRGDWPVMEMRMKLLADLESRRTGKLSYRPLRLDVPRQALQELTWGREVSPHASALGWHRAGEPVRSPQASQNPAVVPGSTGNAEAIPSAAPGRIGDAEAIPSAAAAAGHSVATAQAQPAAPTAALPAGPAALLPSGPAAPLSSGRLNRLGEILTSWLGWQGWQSWRDWSGARRRPPASRAATPPPPAPAARSATGR